MKKIMIFLLVGIFTLVMSASAFAATPEDSGKLDKRIETLEQRLQRIEELKIHNQERQEQLASKKDEFEEFREALAEKRLEVMENRDANLTLLEQNNQLRLDLALTLEEVRDSGGTLPEETITQLKDYNAQIHELINSLKDTKGQIKQITEEYKDLIKEKDYAAMDTAFAKIVAIQTYRYDILVQINDILLDMNALLAASAGSGYSL